MEITDIKIRKIFAEGPMRAVFSVTFDNQLAVHDIKVIYAREKHFIVMPSRKNSNATYRDIVHPINANFRASLEQSILDAYQRELNSGAFTASANDSDNGNYITANSNHGDNFSEQFGYLPV